MQINIAICDDQIKDITDLERMIKQYFFQLPDDTSYQIRTCNSGTNLLQLMNSDKIHVVFLDIDMPGMNGLEIAKQMRCRNSQVFIIFVSSYPQYMRDSFEVQPFHFIEKPLYYENLSHVCDLLLKRISNMNSAIISLHTYEGKSFHNLNDLILIEAVKGTKKDLYFRFSNNETVICQGTITDWENRLKDQGLISPCRGILINLRHLRAMKDTSLIMSDGSTIYASRRRIKHVQERFTDHVISLIN